MEWFGKLAMTGDRVPTEKSKAQAYLMYNEVFKQRRKKLNWQLRRDKRRFCAECFKQLALREVDNLLCNANQDG